MKTWKAALMLVWLTSNAWAQPGGLTNADVEEHPSLADPARAVQELSDGWIAFSVPAIEGTPSPCCWQGKWNSRLEVGCSLETERQSYGTRHDSPIAQHLVAYARINNGEVEFMRVVGDSCPVDGRRANVAWLVNTDETAGLNWLDRVARQSEEEARHTALYAMALHASPGATGRLQALVTDSDSELAEEATFWLGEARGESGYEALDALLDELPHGDPRRHINFALALNDSPAAFERLAEIARADADPVQRANALFWLAQEHPDRAKPLLLDALARETDGEVREQAVFAVSQLPENQGTRILLALAQDPDQPREIRRQAMFWLAHSDDDEGLAALEELLTR